MLRHRYLSNIAKRSPQEESCLTPGGGKHSSSRQHGLIMRKFLSILLAIGLLGFAPAASMAATISFNQTSVREGGQTAYGTGSWSISNSNGTQYKVTGKTKRERNGGNSAYWKAQLQSSSGICVSGISGKGGGVSVSCHMESLNYTTLQGNRYNATYWQSSSKYKPVQQNSKTAWVNMATCVDKRFQVDPCSAYYIPREGIQFRK